MLQRSQRNGRVRKDPAGQPDGSTEIATARTAAITVALGSRSEAVVFRSLDNVAVWVNEGGAGGEVIR